MASRFAYNNLFVANATLIGASSQAQPVRALRDQQRTFRWRSKTGWTIVQGFNDVLLVRTDTDEVCAITPGYYATGAAMAAQIQTNLQTQVDAGFTCTYDTGTKKFTIARAVGFKLWWTQSAASIANDIGWAGGAITGVAVSHTSETVTYQSRHFVLFDLGSSQALTMAATVDDNVSAAGSVTIQGGAFSGPLSGTEGVRIAYFGSTAAQVWRILISDVTNAAGYTEVGIAWGGTYIEPGTPFIGFIRGREELSAVLVADFGAHYRDTKGTRRSRTMEFPDLSDSEAAAIELMGDTVKAGGNLLFTLDPAAAPEKTLYGFFPEGPAPELVDIAAADLRWHLSMIFEEAL